LTELKQTYYFTASTSLLNKFLSNSIEEVYSLKDGLRLRMSRKNSGPKDNNKHVAEAISNSLKVVMPQRMDMFSDSTM
jgi:hypothetical protein